MTNMGTGTRSDRRTQMRQKWLGKLQCRLGRHAWKSYADVVQGQVSQKPISLFWKQCVRCHDSKMKMILQ